MAVYKLVTCCSANFEAPPREADQHVTSLYTTITAAATISTVANDTSSPVFCDTIDPSTPALISTVSLLSGGGKNPASRASWFTFSIIHGSLVVVGHAQSASTPLTNTHLSMRSHCSRPCLAAHLSVACLVVPAQQPGSSVVVVSAQSLGSFVTTHWQSLRSQ